MPRPPILTVVNEVASAERTGARRGRLVGAGLAGLLVAGALAYGLFRPAESEPAGSIPEFDLELLSGDGRLSSDDLQGHPVVLNFWASWCIPCRDETPLLQKSYEEHRDRGVIFVGVNVRDNPEDARSFVKQFGVTYPVVRDEDEELFSALELPGLPGTFFVTPGGDLLTAENEAPPEGTEAPPASYVGGITKEQLDAALDRLLEFSAREDQ